MELPLLKIILQTAKVMKPMSTDIDITKQARFFALSSNMLAVAGFDGYFKHLNSAREERTNLGRRNLERDTISISQPL